MCYWLRLKYTIRGLLVVIKYLWLAKHGISRHLAYLYVEIPGYRTSLMYIIIILMIHWCG